MSETQLVKLVLEYLWYNKIFAYRNNTGAVKAEYAGKTRFVRFGVSGAPDIIACIKCHNLGILVGLEIKSKKGIQSPSQKEFQDKMQNTGAFYFVIRDVDELKVSIDYVRKEVSELFKNNA